MGLAPGTIIAAIIADHIANISTECGRSLAELGRALKDGRISPKEAERCRKEIFDLIRAAAELYSHLEPYLEAGR